MLLINLNVLLFIRSFSFFGFKVSSFSTVKSKTQWSDRLVVNRVNGPASAAGGGVAAGTAQCNFQALPAFFCDVHALQFSTHQCDIASSEQL